MKRLGLVLAVVGLLGAGYYLRRLAPRALTPTRMFAPTRTAERSWSSTRALLAPVPIPRPTPPPDTTELRVKPWAKAVAQPFLALFMEGRKPGATTIGHRIYYFEPPSDQTRRHEYVHVEQANRLGTVGFMAAYTTEWFKKGYRQNRFEVEACDRARRTP